MSESLMLKIWILVSVVSMLKIFLTESMLLVLVSLETLPLMIFLTYNMILQGFMPLVWVSVILTLMVCESVLGLSVFINLTNLTGSSSLMSMKLLQL